MGLNDYSIIIGWAVMLGFFTWHFGVTLGVVPKILMQTFSPQKLRWFKLYLQENLLRGWEMCGIFSLFSEAVGSSHVWPGTASASCDFRTVLPVWSCWLKFVPLFVWGLVLTMCMWSNRHCLWCHLCPFQSKNCSFLKLCKVRGSECFDIT